MRQQLELYVSDLRTRKHKKYPCLEEDCMFMEVMMDANCYGRILKLFSDGSRRCCHESKTWWRMLRKKKETQLTAMAFCEALQVASGEKSVWIYGQIK